MTLEQTAKQYGVCDLKYAIKLKELGCKQEGLWHWIEKKLKSNLWLASQILLAKQMGYSLKFDIYSAPTASELGESLPRVARFKDKETLKRLSYSNFSKPEAESWYGCGAWGKIYIDCILYSLSGKHADKDRWNVNYLTCSPNKLLIHNEQAKTEADSRAKMKIWLIENKYMEVG